MTSSYFGSAHHFVSNIDTVITATNYHQHGGGVSDWWLQQLREHVSDGSMHNSADRFNAPTCHPDTRKAVQEDIFGWMTHDDRDGEPKKILWMSGPAGCGKTAIAGSVAETCQEWGILAASFFFSSFSPSLSRRRKRFLIPTSGILRQHVLSTIKRDPAILSRHVKEQCRTLLLQPLLNHPWLYYLPRIIVVDGLDEVESEDNPDDIAPNGSRLQFLRGNQVDQVEILEALLILTHPTFPFRLFIASRPERAIREWFSSQVVKRVTREIFLDDKYNPDADIELFLRSKFSDIGRRYFLTSDWPADEAIDTLVYSASGQFIHAATIVRFVEDGTLTPPEKLDRVLRMRPLAKDRDHPLKALYALYQLILLYSPDPALASQWVMHIAGGVTYDLSSKSARYCRMFLEHSPGQAELLLGNLSSLLHIPTRYDTSSPYRMYHRSLGEYLQETLPSRDVEEFRVHNCLRILANKGPSVPASYSEKVSFSEVFIHDWEMIKDAILRATKTDLAEVVNSAFARCDLLWWIDVLLTSEPRLAVECVTSSFAQFHQECDNSNAICIPACRLWRQGILTYCRSNGWTTPGEAVIMKEREWNLKRDSVEAESTNEDDYRSDADDFTFVGEFRPPGKSVTHLISAVDGTV